MFLLTHGKGGLNPGFWRFFAAVGPLYFIERLLRIQRARQRVVVLSCTIMDDVFSLEFAKEGIFSEQYRDGQYIFLNAPAVSSVQWHPFTISSAPEEKTVTVHIRVSGEGSWTKELCAYVAAMGPKGKPFFALDRQGPQGKLMGHTHTHTRNLTKRPSRIGAHFFVFLFFFLSFIFLSRFCARSILINV